MTLRVFIGDHSARMRRALAERVNQHPWMEVVGTASSIDVIRSRVGRSKPDVLLLDASVATDEARSLCLAQPTVLIVPASMTTSPLAAPPVSPLARPEHTNACALESFAELVITSLERLAGPPRSGARPRPALIALGSSTGGVTALSTILPMFPADSPPIVIVEHMPEGYTRDLASRLNAMCSIHVREAGTNVTLEPGLALIAPGGDAHLHIHQAGGGFVTSLSASPPTDGHCPSVTELFRSVARSAGVHAAAALLTGMGRDGAQGLLEIRRAGGFTIGQDAKTSVVYGMPKAARELGAVVEERPLEEIPARLLGMAPNGGHPAWEPTNAS